MFLFAVVKIDEIFLRSSIQLRQTNDNADVSTLN